jgi:hypothetical protein
MRHGGLKDTAPISCKPMIKVVFRFHRMLPEYVWDAGVLEGNPFTFPEVKTLLEGVTVGGRKLSDQEQILNLAESAKSLMDLVKNREFTLDKSTFCSLHALVARNEALEWGHFRGEGTETQLTPDVALGERGRFKLGTPRTSMVVCTPRRRVGLSSMRVVRCRYHSMSETRAVPTFFRGTIPARASSTEKWCPGPESNRRPSA